MNSHALRPALVWAAAVLVVAGCTTWWPSTADGTSVPAGFTRIAAFRGGVTGNADACYSRYPG